MLGFAFYSYALLFNIGRTKVAHPPIEVWPRLLRTNNEKGYDFSTEF